MNPTEATLLQEQGPTFGAEPALAPLDILLATAPVGLAFLDDQFRFLKVNEALSAMNGIPTERLIGRTIAEVFPHLWPNAEKRYRDVLESGIPLTNFEVSGESATHPGQVRHWLCNYYPLMSPEGKVLGIGITVNDITERKLAEEDIARRAREQAALFEFTSRLHRAREMPEIYEAALNAIQDGIGCDRASILLFDEVGVMRFVAWRGLSDAYRAAASGHSPWQQGEIGSVPFGIEDITHDTLAEPLKSVIIQEGISALGFIPLVASGRLIGKFMVYYNSPHIFGDEEFYLALTIGRQIAFAVERERIEALRFRAVQAQQKSEERLQNIFDQSTAGIAQVDKTGRFVLANQRFCEITGYSAEELQEKTCHELTHPEDQACDREMFEKALQERAPYIIEKRYIRPDGTVVWVRNSVSEIKETSGDSQHLLAVSIDITEHKRREQGQALLAAIVNSSEDAIVSKDLNGIVTSWNASAERIYGWKAEEIIGQSKALVIPPDLPGELPYILERIRAGRPIEHYETRRVRKDGTLIDVDISVSPVRDGQGQIVGAATIVRDITERRRTERELKQRQAEVEALNLRLKRAMQETHHRVKNNLQVISAMVDMQTIEHLGEGTIPVKEFERLNTHIRTLSLMHDLLTKSVRENEEQQRVSSQEALGRLLGLLEKVSGGRPIPTHLENVELLSKQIVTLSLTLNELVSNAVKHAAGDVEVRFEVRGPLAELSVSDDGPGFPPGFDPMTAAHTGLDLVLGLVDSDLKGTVIFENRVGGGACVRVTFPLPEQEESRSLPQESI